MKIKMIIEYIFEEDDKNIEKIEKDFSINANPVDSIAKC